MPIYQLTEEPVFPPAELADKDGLLAVGGDLSPQRLLNAYASGIFPWYSNGQPILWWSPDPRMVLFPENFRRHKNLSRIIDKKNFTFTFDQAFEQVIHYCSSVKRERQTGTWITSEMKDAYIQLHKAGYAHSVETYSEGKLSGGLYGVSIGTMFFGESMFHLKTDASKVALWHLVDFCLNNGINVIDVQQNTSHLKSMGAELISRKNFLTLLEQNLVTASLTGDWQ
ncbi:MAG: leucyl/phenylalanyl-tRNA--protein transferase [Bacteroidetes bacterium]|nr:leucyl/phenylalanyl-tRNA--protein transferase [Bacteroidota bacterium]